MAFNRPVYMKEYHKRWYQRNKARLSVKGKLYAKANKATLTVYKNQWYQANGERLRRAAKQRYRKNRNGVRLIYNLKKLYGLSLSEYKTLVKKHKRVCAICKKTTRKRLSVDHCHQTGKVRGLLCRNCNFALGLFRDQPKILVSALKYLKETA